jgi:hypothetical protein
MATIKGLVGTAVSRAIQAPQAGDTERFRTGLGAVAPSPVPALQEQQLQAVVGPVVKKPNPLGAQDAAISNFLNPSTVYKGR